MMNSLVTEGPSRVLTTMAWTIWFFYHRGRGSLPLQVAWEINRIGCKSISGFFNGGFTFAFSCIQMAASPNISTSNHSTLWVILESFVLAHSSLRACSIREPMKYLIFFLFKRQVRNRNEKMKTISSMSWDASIWRNAILFLHANL
jgi:hypothetical protein